MSDAELIERLIDATARASDWRSGAVRPRLLPLFNNWGPVDYLTPDGAVVRDDIDGGPPRPVDPDDRDFALARAVERYPELAHLAPVRPPAAITCGLCRGRGKVILAPGEKPCLYCPGCNSLGWTV